MNERFRELATEVGISTEYLTNTKQIVLIEKFAELIVRECADIVKETRWMIQPSQEQIARSIKQHFGVE
jgi:hypothetical protein